MEFSYDNYVIWVLNKNTMIISKDSHNYILNLDKLKKHNEKLIIDQSKLISLDEKDFADFIKLYELEKSIDYSEGILKEIRDDFAIIRENLNDANHRLSS